MKATTRTHYYRQQPILVIKHENHAGTYYTATNEANEGYLAESASDDAQSDDAKFPDHAFATEAGALAAQHAEIEDALGSAQAEEIREALDRILAAATAREVTALNQAIASFRKANGYALHAGAEANKALADALAIAVDGTENSNHATAREEAT